MNKIEELEKEFENLVDEFEKKLEDLKKRFDECEKSEKENKRWRAEKDEEYYFFSNNLNVCSTTEEFLGIDDAKFEIHNYFKTQEEAEKVAEKIKIYIELKDLAEALNEGVEIDWNNCRQWKHCIYKDNDTNKIYSESCYSRKYFGTIYCLNSDFLEIAIERIGEERLMKLFE